MHNNVRTVMYSIIWLVTLGTSLRFVSKNIACCSTSRGVFSPRGLTSL